MLRPPPSSTLFPYTTLFRSDWFEKAVRAQRDAMALAPQVLKFRDYLGDHLFWLYDVHAEEGRLEPALASRSEEHTSELQSQFHLVCRLLLEKKKINKL